MTKKYLLKNGVLYKMYKDQWGSYPRQYINFDTLTKYQHPNVVQLYINDDGVLCTEYDQALPSWIQEIYGDYVDEEVERMLTGDA